MSLLSGLLSLNLPAGTGCRWDFYWDAATARAKLLAPAVRAAPVLRYPQGDLQGVFALMLPSAHWLSATNYMRQFFDRAPADWLIGRWLFQHNWRLAFMPSHFAIFHRPGTSFADSSRITVASQLASDPLFRDQPLQWDHCPRNSATANHPFKFDDFYRLRWVRCLLFSLFSLPLTLARWGARTFSWSCPGRTSRGETWASPRTWP